nr:hypothetical protein JVH1_0789 [Rhodococcus sp. JVH1]
MRPHINRSAAESVTGASTLTPQSSDTDLPARCGFGRLHQWRRGEIT